MSVKNKLYSLTLTATIFCGTVTNASEESPRCVESKHALKELEQRVFDSPNNDISPLSLRELEVKKVELEAKKSILDTFSNIHKQRQEFQEKLNPTHPNSFYSKSMNAKTAVQETQKQIISNYILSSITNSISAILEKDNFLETKDSRILESSEWKSAKSNYEKFNILSGSNPYSYIKNRCEEMKFVNNQNDPCTNFTDIKEKAVMTIFMQTNQDMVSDVTNNFFKAYNTANKAGKGLDTKLKEIQKEQITDYVDTNMLNEERTILISSLLQETKQDGIFDTENLSKFYKVNSIDPQTEAFSASPLKTRTPANNGNKTIENIKKVEEDFGKAKECFTKKSFGIDVRCGNNKSISNFFNRINDLKLSKTVAKFDEDDLLNNENVKNFNAKSLTSDIAKNELRTLKMLSRTDLNKSDSSDSNKKRYQQMREICKGLAPLTDKDFAETLWDCIDDLHSSNNKPNVITDKKSKLDTELAGINELRDKLRDSVNSKFGDLVKYAAATAKEYCQDGPSTYNTSCIGSESKITTLVFGNERFLTNLDNIEWNISGKKETEDILSNVTKKCSPIIETARQTDASNSQIKKMKNKYEPTDSKIKSICTFAKNDLDNLNKRTPSAKQKAFRKNFHSRYDSSKGKMVHSKKVGVGSMIAKSAGNSLLTSGLPLYFQNASFKNNLPYQTDMAIYQKNYMYMMSNPQYWSSSMFTGYGVSSVLNGYASNSSYYNFGN